MTLKQQMEKQWQRRGVACATRFCAWKFWYGRLLLE